MNFHCFIKHDKGLANTKNTFTYQKKLLIELIKGCL